MTKKKLPRRAPQAGTAEWIKADRKGGGYYVCRAIKGGKVTRTRMRNADGEHRFTNKEKDKAKAQVFAKAMVAEREHEIHAPINNTKATTVQIFGEQWTSGALFREYGEVKRLRIKASAQDDANRLARYIYPYIGKLTVAEVEEDDVQRAFARAFETARQRNGKPLRAATRRHVYMVTHRLFELAVQPGKLRKDNPVGDHLLPAKDADKEYGFLYPDELIRLLGCTDIELARRMYYALATYTGLRKSTLLSLTWSDINFDRKTIQCVVTKNRAPQYFAQEDKELPGLVSLMVLLRRYYELLGEPDEDDHILNYKALGIYEDKEAVTLRSDLLKVNITRKELHNTKKETTIEPLRFHDLRATFVTWARRVYKPDGWISDRTGHITAAIMKRYERAARLLRDLSYEPFPDISQAVPELAGQKR